MAPYSPATLTRGGVLVAIGRAADAEAMLAPLAGAMATVPQRMLCHLFLAQAAAAQGRPEQARSRLSAARMEVAARSPARRVLLGVIARAEGRWPLAPVDPAPDAAISRA